MKQLPIWQLLGGGGGAVAQSVERVTPGQEVPGLIPAPYWLGRCQYNVTC